MIDEVILVDEQDHPIGRCEKLQAHKEGKLHRAFSIFIFNSAGEMLLHKRALGKYHSGGLWTNACCSHPRPDETVEQAAYRRLQEELGFVCPVLPSFCLHYQAKVAPDLIEHEYDHVLVGTYDGQVDAFNREEVAAIRWVPVSLILEEVKQTPEQFTAWFLLALPKVIAAG